MAGVFGTNGSIVDPLQLLQVIERLIDRPDHRSRHPARRRRIHAAASRSSRSGDASSRWRCLAPSVPVR